MREAGKAYCIALSNMNNDKIKVDLYRELQSSIIPSNSQIENILREFKEKEDDEQQPEDDEVLRKNAIQTELRLSCKGKKVKPELRSCSNLESFSQTHTVGLLTKPDNNF